MKFCDHIAKNLVSEFGEPDRKNTFKVESLCDLNELSTLSEGEKWVRKNGDKNVLRRHLDMSLMLDLWLEDNK